MTPTLAHQLLLLALDDATGESRIEDPQLARYALGGAVVAELQLRGRLVRAGDRFELAGPASAVPVLREAESELRGSEQTLAEYVARIGASTFVRPLVLDELVAAGALRREHDRIWFVPYRTRWPSADAATERTLVEHLRAWVARVGPADPPGPEDHLLSLLHACALLGAVWTDAERVALDATIRERIALAPIGRTVRAVAVQADEAELAVLFTLDH